MLDCGWNDHFDTDLLKPLAVVAPTIDAVLLSHPDTEHLGALPYAFGKLGLRCKVYATLPVHKMGLMFMYDNFLARSADSDFDVFSLDDVDTAFGAFVPVRYAQHSTLCGNSAGIITVTAHPAGHMLGGAFWKIQKDAEDIVYAVDYNHRKEKLLNGSTLETINRPSLLVTDANNAQGCPPTKSRDEDVIDTILRSVRQDGNVLIPIDSAGRVLELLLFLEEKWSQKQLGAYQLVLLTCVASNTLEFARSHLEWMGDSVGRNFERNRQNPFNTRYLIVCHSLQEFRTLRKGPKVVLASVGTLAAGPARQLFCEWAADPRSLVILTDKLKPGTLSYELQEVSCQHPGARKPLRVTLSRRVPIVGDELRNWLRDKQSFIGEPAAKVGVTSQDATLSNQSELSPCKLPAEAKNTEFEKEEYENETLVLVKDAGCRTSETTLGKDGVIGAELHRRRCLVDGFEHTLFGGGALFPDELWVTKETDFGEAILEEDITQALQVAPPSTRAVNLPQSSQGRADAALPLISVVEKQNITKQNLINPPVDTPTKVVTEVRVINLRAAVHVYNFGGRADGRSVRTIIKHIEPRHIILVHGTTQNTEFLKSHLQTSLAGVVIDTPANGETVDCTSERTLYRLELSQELLSRSHLREAAGFQIGWIDGFVGDSLEVDGIEVTKLLKSAPVSSKGSTETAADILDGIATKNGNKLGFGVDTQGNYATSSTAVTAFTGAPTASLKEGRYSAFVGDLKLSDFKMLLSSAKLSAEFVSGRLVCAGGMASVHKLTREDAAGVFRLEGGISDFFYDIRSILCAQYQAA